MSLAGKKPGGEGIFCDWPKQRMPLRQVVFNMEKTKRKKVQEGFDLLKDLDFEHLIPEPSQKL